ncbi:MAG: RnfABCDGE type electron transport complex subunit D [Clostridia bacterium]|nr:RnfABCDGE type electron transport complex subunit D [Clostridia bacterium]
MTDDTVRIHASLREQPYDRERTLDWLTALLPVAIVAALYYRLYAAALAVVSVGGYLMAAVLLAWATGRDLREMRVLPALLSGLLAAFFLPALAPLWAAALFGALAATAEVGLDRLRKLWKIECVAMPTAHPVALAYLVTRALFPAAFTAATMPAQFSQAADRITVTPLAALRGEEMSLEWWRLFFGVHAGAVGETCTAALLLCAAYLLIRRRIRLVAPGTLLAVVTLLSWVIWGEPLYALLGGSLVLAALLLADETYAPVAPLDQTVVGVVAAVITVLVRRFGAWDEGVVLGVAVVQLLVPALPFVYRFCAFVWRHVAAWTSRAWAWARPYIVRFLSFAASKIAVAARAFWRWSCRAAKATWDRIKNFSNKRKNNG